MGSGMTHKLTNGSIPIKIGPQGSLIGLVMTAELGSVEKVDRERYLAGSRSFVKLNR